MVKTRCEVYSRVVGYIRPVEQWNDAKQQEFKERKLFDVKHATKFDKVIVHIENSVKQGLEVDQTKLGEK